MQIISEHINYLFDIEIDDRRMLEIDIIIGVLSSLLIVVGFCDCINGRAPLVPRKSMAHASTQENFFCDL